MIDIRNELQDCRLCKDRFANTATSHAPRPVIWFAPGARILIAGQAPGMKVHQSGRPFTDPSGDRLRDWLGIVEETFYDKSRIAIVPMAFCFPGYNDKGSDLPPPPICARTWRDAALEMLADVKLTLVIGAYAMKYHIGKTASVTDAVQNWRNYGEDVFVLPHPSWRNTGWIRKNPWFEQDVLPRLRARVSDVLT